MMSQRPPARDGTIWLKVTRPMTVPSLMRKKFQVPSSKFQTPECQSARWPRLRLEPGTWSLELSYLIHNRCDHPTRRAPFVADALARREAIGRNDDALMHAGAMRIDRDLGRAFGLPRVIDRLTNNQPPSLEAGMFAGGDDIAFYAGEEHKGGNPKSEIRNPKEIRRLKSEKAMCARHVFSDFGLRIL